MICEFDHSENVWIAAGRGPMRPIIVEGDSYAQAHKGFAEEHARQVDEEKRFAREYEEQERATAIALHLERKGEDYKMMMREAHAYKGEL